MTARRLVLVRHAEAGLAPIDRDRPLTPRGLRDAAAVGVWLAELGTAPDRVVVSPARRARETWDQVRSALDGEPGAEIDERIYDNTVDALLDVVRETEEEVRTLVLVGHNPAAGQLAHDLDDGAGPEAARRTLGRGFPAGAVAALDLDVPFPVLEEGRATLVDVLVPSD